MSVEIPVPIYPDLKGKRVLITGGSSGIGKATAIAFSKNEVVVTIVARTVSKMEKVVEALPTKAYYAQADLTKTEDIERAVGEAIEKMGGIDILINNGAVGNEDIVDPTDPKVLKHLLDIHVIGSMTLTHACKDQLIANKGCVVNVSSALSEVIYEAMIPYNIAKAAEDALTRNMAMFWAHHGVRVNSINPGVVDTEAWDSIAEKIGIPKKQILEMNASLHAMGKNSQPEEQANAILFLCSGSSASTVTGNNLFTDGGIRLTSWFNLALKAVNESNGGSSQ